MVKRKNLRVLIVEDVEDDALLLVRELRKNGYDPVYRRVETPEEMREALHGTWDLILSDFTLPRFNGVQALKLVKVHDLDIPFIVVSGTIGESVAVSMMRAGAHDYFLKGHLSLLAPAIERELRDARERHARRQAETERDRLFNFALDMFCVSGFDGYFKQLNPAWERALGWSIEELLARPWLDLVHPEDQDQTRQADEQLRCGQVVSAFRNRYQCKDGTYRWISWNSFPLPEEERIFSVARDITEQRNLEEQLRQAQKMEAVGQLAGGVAHDFNNQLTVIGGYSDILLQGISKDDSTREPITAICEACQRAQGLTSQLLAFSRKQVLREEVINLDVVLRDMNGPLGRMVGERVQFSLLGDGKLENVKLDRRQFEQAIINIVINARDAMPDGGRVAIEASNISLGNKEARKHSGLLPGPYVQVRLNDTGVGMPPNIRQQVFEPFFTTKEVGKGTGLGLSMVYGFVRQSGGVIHVESKPDHGATFTMLFPVTNEPAAAPGKVVKPMQHVGNETILVVEDDESVRQLVVRVLREAGYTALETANAREALPLGREYAGRIDLMVADVVMPGMSGPDLAEAIRPIRKDMPVLFISGYTRITAADGGVLSRGSEFLGKPFSPEELLGVIRQLLDAQADSTPEA